MARADPRRGRALRVRLEQHEDGRLQFARELLGFMKTNGDGEIFFVPELGNSNPSYGLSCFPDVWKDAQVAGADLRKIWNESP